LYESRLDNTVDASSLGVGERVDVRTKMGVTVETGNVIASNPLGAALDSGNFYNRDLYLFAPHVVKPVVEIQNDLHGMSVDDRAYQKMLKMGIVMEADKTPSDSEIDAREDPKNPEKKSVDKDSEKEGSKDGKSDKETGEKDGAEKFDTEKLPDDIKQAISSASKINDAQVESILSDIGDASMKSLRAINVTSEELYRLAGEIQAVVRGVFKKGDKK
jgi:hypothetical protein